MCGRYTYTQIPEIDAVVLGAGQESLLRPRYNIAPGQFAPLLTMDDPRTIQFFRWGLVPSWANDERVGYKLINARVETLLEKPSFRHLVPHQRCLVLADSFYEWKQEGSVKIPHRILHADGSPFYMAGLWSSWKKATGDWLFTYTILTTEPNELVATLHDRMPVILQRSAALRWIQPSQDPEGLLTDLARPLDPALMSCYPVSPAVGKASNDGPELIVPFSSKH